MNHLSIVGAAPGFQKYPGYRMAIEPSTDLHQIVFNEAVIAASDRALIVREQDLHPVVYFPAGDVELSLLLENDHQTHCPFKGDARYWNVSANGKAVENAAWSYPDPYNEAKQLRGAVAFYLDHMVCYWRNGIEQPLVGPGKCGRPGCDEIQAA